MSLIDDDQVGSVLEKCVPVALGLHVVDARDYVAVVPKDVEVGPWQAALKACHTRWLHQRGLDVELGAKFVAPLLTEVGRTQHANSLNHAAVEEFAGNQRGFDGLANAHIVGNQQSNWVEPQRHDQWHELIRTRAHGQASHRPERASTAAQSKTGRIVQKPPGRRTQCAARVGYRVGCFVQCVRLEQAMDANLVGIVAVDGAQPDHVQLVLRQDDPVALPRLHQRAGPPLRNARNLLRPTDWSTAPRRAARGRQDR